MVNVVLASEIVSKTVSEMVSRTSVRECVKYSRTKVRDTIQSAVLPLFPNIKRWPLFGNFL